MLFRTQAYEASIGEEVRLANFLKVLVCLLTCLLSMSSSERLLLFEFGCQLKSGSVRWQLTHRLYREWCSKGAQSFIETLVPRLNDHHNGSVMPFELEVLNCNCCAVREHFFLSGFSFKSVIDRGLQDVKASRSYLTLPPLGMLVFQ